MRIALDATYSVSPEPSGIAIYSRQLMSGLSRLHPEDTYLHCFRPKQFLRTRRATASNVNRRMLIPPLPTFRADLFHALNQRVDRRTAKRVVSTFHDLFVMTSSYSTPEFRKRFTEQARHAAANSDLIIAVSRFTARQVTALLGVEPSRVRVVPHGVHMPEVAPPEAREKMVLFVGALQLRKNIGRLIKAFEGVADPEWRLVLAGAPSGFGAGEILATIERSHARERIEVTGYVSERDLINLYSRASVFAFPSLDEGFGIPVLEAMAYEIPVLTSNRSGTAEVAGDAALLVDPEDVTTISAGLTRLMNDAETRAELRRRGKLQASRYGWERTVRETQAVYKELLA